MSKARDIADLDTAELAGGAGSGLDADKLDGQQGAYYTAYADTAISNLVDSSPASLNTLNELAAALGDDVNFSTTVTDSIALKAPLASPTFTGTVTTAAISGTTGQFGTSLNVDGTATVDGLTVGGISAYPTTNLSRDGGSAATQGYLTTGFSAIGYSGGTGADTYMVSEHGFGFAVNAGTNALVITDTGNVGINTSVFTTNAVIKELVVKSTATNGVASYTLTTTDNGLGGGMRLTSFNDANALVFGMQTSYDEDGTSPPTERMRIDGATGNVGIGVSNPSAKFHASQTYSTPTNGISADTVGIFSKNNTANGNANVSVLSRSSGEARLYLGDETDENKWAITSKSYGGGLSFESAGTERLRLNAAGDVIIGSSGVVRRDLGSATSPVLSLEGTFPAINLRDDGGGGIFYGVNGDTIYLGGNGSTAIMNMYVNDAPSASFIAAGGITFNGDTSTSNALNDYEQGSWSPTLTAVGGTTSASFTAIRNHYTKVGRLVTLTTYVYGINYSGITDGSYIVLGNFPFASDDNYGGTALAYANGNVDSLYLNSGQAYAYLCNDTNGNEFLQSGTAPTTNKFMATITYFAT